MSALALPILSAGDLWKNERKRLEDIAQSGHIDAILSGILAVLSPGMTNAKIELAGRLTDDEYDALQLTAG